MKLSWVHGANLDIITSARSNPDRNEKNLDS